MPATAIVPARTVGATATARAGTTTASGKGETNGNAIMKKGY
jgi:hypothetical protein